MALGAVGVGDYTVTVLFGINGLGLVRGRAPVACLWGRRPSPPGHRARVRRAGQAVTRQSSPAREVMAALSRALVMVVEPAPPPRMAFNRVSVIPSEAF